MRTVQSIYLLTAVVALASSKSVSDYTEGRGLLGNLLGGRPKPAPIPAPVMTGSNNGGNQKKGLLSNLLGGVTNTLGQTLKGVGTVVGGLAGGIASTVDNVANNVLKTVTGQNGLGLNLGAQIQTGAGFMSGINNGMNGMFGQYSNGFGYDANAGSNFGGGAPITPVTRNRFVLLIMKMPPRF